MPTEKSRSQKYLDALVRHQIFLLRTSGTMRTRIREILNETEPRMADRIRRTKFDGDQNRRVERAMVLFAALQGIRWAAWRKVRVEWTEQLLLLAQAEPRFARAATANLDLELPTAEDIREVVRKSPYLGRSFPEWVREERAGDLERIRTALVVGAVQGEDAGTIARRIVGSARTNGADGSTEVTRRNTETLAATLTLGITAGMRDRFYAANSGFFKDGELWVSVLDNRTTPICRSLDGKIFPLGQGPHPPLHFRCRSMRTLLLDGEAPARPTYQEWLMGQTTEFQDEVLGKTRGALFRKGGFTLDRFVDRRGWDNIPLQELARQERQAFLDAGLDPEDYLR
jgi:SPP1 gp7 family putative phage head morphogenesis protein